MFYRLEKYIITFFQTEFDSEKNTIDDGVVEQSIVSVKYEDEKSEKMSLKEGTYIVQKDNFYKSVWNYIFIIHVFST